jgi:hypothetical protein
MSTQEQGEEHPFDKFELAVTVLLGLAAVGAAVSSLQAGQWGGKMVEAYGEAATLSSKASSTSSQAAVDIAHDLTVDIQAKAHILEAVDAGDDGRTADEARGYEIASYLYSRQLSDAAYDALGLPDAMQVHDAVEDPDWVGIKQDIPTEELHGAVQVDLDEEYYDTMLKPGEELFAQADSRFDEGRKFNGIGDTYDLIGVFYTVAIFFAGLGLVIKTKTKWGLFGVGLVIWLIASGYMTTLPWAS